MIPTSLTKHVSRVARRAATNLTITVRQAPWRRHIITVHDAKAQFVTLDSLEALVSKDVIISRSGEDQSYVQMDRGVGMAMKAAIVRQLGVSLTGDPDATPLRFYHKSLHFAHELLPYPRLIIDKGLAGPKSGDVSSATLWTWAPAASEITLNDTSDHEFSISSRETHSRLKGVLEELKDR